MEHRRDIDGLRAVAIILVLLYHLKLAGLTGGYIGVDIFFVISGYLIFGISLTERREGTYSIGRFYLRRIRRILPALTATLIIAAAGSWLLLPSTWFKAFAGAMEATASFTANIYFWTHTGYFTPEARLNPLLHMWSLAVEEQFYILLPLFILICGRWAQKTLVWMVTALLAASLGLCIFAAYAAPFADFFLLPTRAWELLLGALVFLIPSDRAPLGVREMGTMAGLAMIGWSGFALDDTTPYPGLATIPPCLGAALIIWGGEGDGGPPLSAAWLKNPMIVGIGLVSYSLYLIHWPLIVLWRFYTADDPGVGEGIAIGLFSFGLAGLSWTWIEQPFRRWRPATPLPAFAGGAVALGLLAGVGAGILALQGMPSRFPTSIEQTIPGIEQWGGDACFMQDQAALQRYSADACMRVTGHDKTLMLWGDSFAAHYMPGLIADQARWGYNVLQYTAAGCFPLLGLDSFRDHRCADFNREGIDLVSKRHPDAVVLAARWSGALNQWLPLLGSTLSRLQELGVPTYVIGQSPEFPIDIRIISYRNLKQEVTGAPSWPQPIDPSLNRRLKTQVTYGTFIDPLQFLCRDGRCPYKASGQFLYLDYGHFSTVGSKRAVEAYFLGRPQGNGSQ